MKRNEAFPSEFLKSEDVSGEGTTLTMGLVEMREFEDPQTKETAIKPVLEFKETEKKLILNKTNWDRIAKAHGDDSDKWVGKKITVHLEAVTAFGKTSDVVRVK